MGWRRARWGGGRPPAPHQAIPRAPWRWPRGLRSAERSAGQGRLLPLLHLVLQSFFLQRSELEALGAKTAPSHRGGDAGTVAPSMHGRPQPKSREAPTPCPGGGGGGVTGWVHGSSAADGTIGAAEVSRRGGVDAGAQGCTVLGPWALGISRGLCGRNNLGETSHLSFPSTPAAPRLGCLPPTHTPG